MLTYKFISEKLHDGSIAHRPKIDVTLLGTRTPMRFYALLDSGTDVTIIPRSIADFLGIQYDFKSEEKFLGFGKEAFQCAPAEVDITFHGKVPRNSETLQRVPVLVALTGDEKEPVLGLRKIFDSFKVTFLKRKIQLTRLHDRNW